MQIITDEKAKLIKVQITRKETGPAARCPGI